jgi:large subunit ribosomal protein L5
MTLHQRMPDIIKDLHSSLGVDNIYQVPRIDKVIVAMGIGSLATRKGIKDFSDIEEHLTRITGQKPQMILSKKSVSNFKLREGIPSMLRVTLRGKKAHDFLERLNTLVLPRVRDFAGISSRKFDAQANLHMGLKQYDIFPELGPDDMKTPLGMQVSIVTTTTDQAQAQSLLEACGTVFEKNN